MVRTGIDFHTLKPSHFGVAFLFAPDLRTERRGFWACSL
nr:MAG TPA: hypothetical protein [Caudoviricetes sp.]